MNNSKPSVLFICVHNAGKSQTAEAFMNHIAGDQVDVYSGGTGPDEDLAADAVAALAEIGVGVDGQFPKAIDPDILRSADRVVILGDQAKVEPIPGMKSAIETWLTVEPADQGIHGAERAAMVRDDIRQRVEQLAKELLG
jgi:arsenate-mycothiol transferase